MATDTLNLLSDSFWLTSLAAILLALRWFRGLQYSDRLVVAKVRPRSQRR